MFYSGISNMKNLQRKSNRLWIARNKAGLGQKTVARMLGHTNTVSVSYYETGKRHPALETLLKLAVIYQTPVEELYAPVYEQMREEVDVSRTKLQSIIPNAVHSPPPMPAHL